MSLKRLWWAPGSMTATPETPHRPATAEAVRGLAACLTFAMLLGGCSRDFGGTDCAGAACSQKGDLSALGESDDSSNHPNESDLAGVDIAALCGARDGRPHPITTDAEAVALGAGLWARCTGDPIGKSDTVGIEFTVDHHWYALQRDGAGNIIRAPGGFDSQGLFLVELASQFSLFLADGGRYFFPVRFEDAPRKLLTSNGGVGTVWTYVGL